MSILQENQSELENFCTLKFDGPPTHKMLTGIICTISKSSQKFSFIKKMIRAGMTIVRLNLAYDTHEFHKQTIELVREAANEVTKERGYFVNVAIAVDIRGPEIRTGHNDTANEIELKKGDNIRLTTNMDFYEHGSKDIIYVNYPNIIKVSTPGKFAYVDEGRIKLLIKELTVDCIVCEIIVGGPLGSYKTVTIPGIPVDLPTVTDADKINLQFAALNNVDIIFAAGIRTPRGIRDIRFRLFDKGRDMKILARVQNIQILGNIKELIKVADGIVLSRNDLAMEVTDEKLFLIQKALFSLCNKAGKPVIGAAHLLESMRYSPIPKRPEIFDLGNMVLDGADCIMLSSETAVGQFPEEAGLEMIKICHEAEAAVWYRHIHEDILTLNFNSMDAAHGIALGAIEVAKRAVASIIVVLTTSGRSASLVSRYRPRCPIVGVTRCSRSARQMLLHRGVIPVLYKEPFNKDWTTEQENRLKYCLLVSYSMNIVQPGDPIVVISSWKDTAGFTNTMRVVYAHFDEQDVRGQSTAEIDAHGDEAE